MKFLVDAQLPQRMTSWFNRAGHDALHTLDLPLENRTPDDQLIGRAEQDERVLITKDADFVNQHMLQSKPAKLLLVSTGNISNSELEKLIVPLISELVREFQTNSFLELGKTGLIVRG